MTAPRSDASTGDATPGDTESYTVDELAAATQTTVRNLRYYAGLGLLPAPDKRGRVAYYGGRHRARLELVRALQDHGFTLAAVERYLTRLPQDASPEDLAAHRVMLTSWKPAPTETLSRVQLERRAGRTLDDAQLRLLGQIDAVRTDGPVETAERFEVTAGLEVAVRLLALDLPMDSLLEANEAISRHMGQLADELTDVLRLRVMAPFRRRAHSEEDTQRFEALMTELRELTMESVVSGYQRAADQVIRRSLGD